MNQVADRPFAVRFVDGVARSRRVDAVERIRRADGGWSDRTIDELAHALPRAGRLTLNLHPDRPTRAGATVANGLLADGRYLSQFVTGASNGSRSAVDGGERDGWERTLFGDAYRSSAPADRPVYGSLDLLVDPHGGSPRFGSSFVVLRPHVGGRITCCIGDSHVGPTDVGTVAEPMSILAGLVEQAATGRLLDRPLGLDDLVDAITGRRAPTSPARVLDGYVEVQVHGGVDLRDDVDAVVLDPSLRSTAVDRVMTEGAAKYGFAVRWHGGSELDVDDVPTDFRGPTMPALARRVARADGVVDAASIGRAVRADVAAPTLAGDDPTSDLQQLKYLWHTVLQFGHDA